MLRKLLMGTGFAMFATVGTASALVIDNFNTPNSTPFQTTCVGGASNALCPGAGGPSVSNYTGLAADIIGTTRRVTTTLISATEGGFSNTFISDTGNFTHSQTSGSTATTSILWNGGGGAGGLNANLLADGASAFQFQVVQADAGIEWALSLFDGVNTATVTFDTLTSIANDGSPESVFVSFAQLLAANAALNLTSIDTITFTANNAGVVDLDTTVGDIRTVPEPAAMTLLGVGLAGLGMVARRRRKA